MKFDASKLADKFRKVALGYPESYEEAPWGDRVVKVRGNIFLFCGAYEGKLGLSVKLPQSGRKALELPNTEPTGYGLGKSGWVSARFDGSNLDEALITRWIDESYRARAPKTLVKQLDAPPAAPAKRAPAATKKPGKAKPLKARVMLVCEDALRTERALSELAARGVKTTAVDNVAAVRKKLGAPEGDAMKWTKSPPALVERFDGLVPDDERVERRQMFGYPAAFLSGHLFMSLFQDRMLLRLGDRHRGELLAVKGAGQFEPMPGKPMREYVMVPPVLVGDDDAIAPWIARAVEHASSLPPKKVKARPKTVAKAPIAKKAKPKKR